MQPLAIETQDAATRLAYTSRCVHIANARTYLHVDGPLRLDLPRAARERGQLNARRAQHLF